MTNTRKNYEAIAEAILEARNLVAGLDDDAAEVAQAAIGAVAINLAHYFGQDNPRFDIDRFLQAQQRPEPVVEPVPVDLVGARFGDPVVNVEGREVGTVTDTGCDGALVWVLFHGDQVATALEATADGLFDPEDDEAYVLAR